MIRKAHPIAGILGFLTILTFWLASAGSELVGDPDLIRQVKRAILWGLIVLIPALAITGATGFRLGGRAKAGLALAKKRRMPFIAANGLLVLVPCAVALDHLAQAGEFGTTFYIVQAVELAAGALNLTLMGMSIGDGMRLTGRLGQSAFGSEAKPNGGTFAPGQRDEKQSELILRSDRN